MIENEGFPVDSRTLGQKGEQYAAEYLLRKGYQVLARNWHFGHRELDIIARDGDEMVFVEVKSRRDSFYEDPADAVSLSKIHHIVEATDAWLIKNEVDLESRFDIITVVFNADGRYWIDHIERAFTSPVH